MLKNAMAVWISSQKPRNILLHAIMVRLGFYLG